jgi:hypothetical protein
MPPQNTGETAPQHDYFFRCSLMDFYHCTNYGQNKPVNRAILIFNEYCGLFCLRDDESRYVFL